MKRLLAMILTFLSAVFSGLNYQASDDKPFGQDAYYKIDEYDAPDYRSLYDRTFLSTRSSESCRTANYSATGAFTVNPVGTQGTYRGYWFTLHSTVPSTEEELAVSELVLDTNDYIVAPYDCVLESDPVVNNGHNMTIRISLNGHNYRLIFSNLDRWFCCMQRTNPQSDGSWVHTATDLAGHTFNRGDVLARGTSTTSVRIESADDPYNEGFTFWDLYTN